MADPNDRANFGSMFGAASALFSGLGYAGLIYTILLQSKSMKAQQEEYSKNSTHQHEEQVAFNRQLVSMNQTNKISALSALISVYSEDESRYQDTNRAKSDSARLKKEELLKLIDSELKSHGQ
ncbi:MAG: hypothetical protein QM781_11835 [Chitinophagaceae bacterium]